MGSSSARTHVDATLWMSLRRARRRCNGLASVDAIDTGAGRNGAISSPGDAEPFFRSSRLGAASKVELFGGVTHIIQ
jgi:hypothetical protein